MSTTAWTTYKEKVRQLSDRLVEAQRPIRIRDAIKWDDQIESQMIAARFKQLPEIGPEYYAKRSPLPYDPEVKKAEFVAIKHDVETSIGATDPLGAILIRNASEYQAVVEMLQARGTMRFYELSRQLFGSTKDHFTGDTTTVRELGHLLYEILSAIPNDGLGAVHTKCLSAEDVVARLNERFERYFGQHSVLARLDDGILSDAAAGADYIKIKRGATFTERELDMFEVHEGWVHVGTSLNGGQQRVASWLAKGPPCTTGIQEGLAVLMEIITFTATPSRSKKLNNRILACDKAEDGANFLEICEFYRTEGYSEKECFQHAQRIFRGGLIGGGAPFTKDISYCKGFIMIYNFLRTAIRFGRPELIPFLFAGKVTLEDVPVLCRKQREGVVDLPHYLPPQFRDLGGLAMWMAYSNFFNRVNLSSIQEYYRAQFVG